MRSFSILTFCGLIALGLFLSACGGDEPKHGRDAEAMGPPPPPQPVMHAEEPFFNGTLLVDATLSRGVRAGELLNRGGGGRGGRHGGGGHRHHREESDEPSSDHEGEGDEYVYQMRESPYPPVSLRLHAVNKTDAPIEVIFLGCDSALGNFVVHPEKAPLKGSEAVDTEPMNSRLGITGEDIPVTVELKVGGKTEKKVLILKPIASPPPQAPAAK